MKRIVLAVVVVWSVGGILPVPQLCLGAQYAIVMAQERSTKKGDWCQRPAPQMSKNAHACGCHKTDCTDGDPNHLPAHTDANCLNFCNVRDCRCAVHDCL